MVSYVDNSMAECVLELSDLGHQQDWNGPNFPGICRHQLQWRHSERDGVSTHRRLHYFLNCSFMRRSKKTSKLHVTGLCEENPPVTGGLPSHKGPVTRKMFPFDDVIMSAQEGLILMYSIQRSTHPLRWRNMNAMKSQITAIRLFA